MCGIFGIIKSPFANIPYSAKKDIFKQLMQVGILRGVEGSGLFGVNSFDNVCHWFKQKYAGTDLVDFKAFATIVGDIDKQRFTVGHNRLATNNKSTTETAHPFVKDNIVLVHNGVIRNHLTLMPTKSTHVTDTDAAAELLDKCSTLPEIKKTLETFSGPFAFVWYHMKNKCMYFARNIERPMWLTTCTGYDDILFGSEPKMLEWILDRNDVKVKDSTMMKVNTIYKIEGTSVKDWETLSFDPFVIKQSSYTPGTYTSTSGGTNNLNVSSIGKRPVATTKAAIKKILKPWGIQSIKSPIKFILTSGNKIYGKATENPYIQLWGRYIVPEACNKKISSLDVDGIIFLSREETSSFDVRPGQVFSGMIGHLELPYATDVWGPKIIVNNIQRVTDSKTIILPKDPALLGEGIDSEELFVGPEGEIIDAFEFSRYIADGCACCASSIQSDEIALIVWTKESEPVCVKCQGKYYKNNKPVDDTVPELCEVVK